METEPPLVDAESNNLGNGTRDYGGIVEVHNESIGKASFPFCPKDDFEEIQRWAIGILKELQECKQELNLCRTRYIALEKAFKTGFTKYIESKDQKKSGDDKKFKIPIKSVTKKVPSPRKSQYRSQ
jgi:hypothetical protein